MLDKDNIVKPDQGKENNIQFDAENKSNDVSFMTKESIGNIDFFKCRQCPYMALTLKDIKFHWQTSHVSIELENKKKQCKTISVKCPGCLGIFHSENSLKTHLKSHHKMCAKDINKLVHNLVQEFQKKQNYIDNLEVIIEGHTLESRNLPPLIEIPPDPGNHLVLNDTNQNNCTDKITNKDCDNIKQLYLNMGAMIQQTDQQNKEMNHSETKKAIENAPLIIIPSTAESNTIPLLNAIETSLQNPILIDSSNEPKKNITSKNTNKSTDYSKLRRLNSYRQLGIKKSKLCYDEERLSKEFGSRCNVQGCGFRLFSKEKLEYHRMCHTSQSKEFYCDKCKKLFKNIGSINTHLWKEHNVDLELFTCDKCTYKSYYFRQFNLHTKIHLEEKSYTCNVCSKAFKNYKQLTNHKTIHRKDLLKNECDICKMTFSNQRNLKTHKESIHVKQKKFYCEHCKYSCVVKSSLQLHLKIHTGKKSLRCQDCTFKTHDRTVLRRHLRRHFKEKDYKCEYCSYSAIQSTSLKKHLMLKHSSVASTLILFCPHCSYNTFIKDNYEKHLSVHTTNKTNSNNTSKEDSMLHNILQQSTGNIYYSNLNINTANDTVHIRDDLGENNIMPNNEQLPTQNDISISSNDNNVVCELEITTSDVNLKLSNCKMDSLNQRIVSSNECFMPISNLTSNLETENINNNSDMFEPILVINDKQLTSDNDILTDSIMPCELLHETNNLTSSFDQNVNLSSNVYENTKSNNNNIYVKDILDLASSDTSSFNPEHLLPQNILTGNRIKEIDSSNSTPPILLMNPNMDLINNFTSNMGNYLATNSQNGFLHLPLPNSHPGVIDGVPRKKPKISVKSNLILKGPDNLNHFNLQQKFKTLNNDFSMVNSTLFSNENHSMPLSFDTTINNNSQIENNNLALNPVPELNSRDPFISDNSYLPNYLMNTDFNYTNGPTSIVDNNSLLLNDNPAILNETINTDISDVKLENKPYIPIQSESSCNSMQENYSSNASMMFEIPKHTIPLPYNPLPIIKFEQKSNMLGSYIYQDNLFDNTVFNNMENISVIEELPATFENINSEYQSIFRYDDTSSYFENDLAIETLDENEIIVVDDASCDMKSLSNINYSSTFDQDLIFDRFNTHKPLRIHSIEENTDKNQVKEKPRIISEVHISSDKSKIVNFATVKNLGLKLEFPSMKSIEQSQTFLNYSNHKVI